MESNVFKGISHGGSISILTILSCEMAKLHEHFIALLSALLGLESFVNHWLHAHAIVDVMCVPAFVRALNII